MENRETSPRKDLNHFYDFRNDVTNHPKGRKQINRIPIPKRVTRIETTEKARGDITKFGKRFERETNVSPKR